MSTKFAAAALLALCASSAMAITYPDSVTVPLVPVPDDVDPTISFATVPTRELNAVQDFNDYYTFHISSLSDVSLSFISDPHYSTKGVLLKEAVFDLLKVGGPNDFMGTGVATGTNQATFAFEKLLPGDYKVTLLGHSIGKSGGNYYGNLSVTAAVPEPEVLALVLAGVGVVGVMARRKAK
ncbi:MAG: PEP-CTERM sorting domain-containing protein [Burkholderiales bacterium]|jgi:hypothetical protein|nr:MAG: PEP-CTERM sorting domain-containing protein [Burkholderiales bacterium]